MATRYSLFQERWQGCTSCHLHKNRQHVVLARGSIPCDVLFVGEAPGVSEDSIGIPFIGPAGKLLDYIRSRAIGSANVSWAMTNLVCCIPLGENGNKTGEPSEEYIRACSVRLYEFLEISRPKLMIAVGSLARDFLEQGYKYSLNIPNREVLQVSIIHPAAILRSNVAQQGLAVQRCVITISNALEEMLERIRERKV